MNTTPLIIGVTVGVIALLVVADRIFTHRGHIDPGTVMGKVENGALLIDVRSPDEFTSGHITGAINIPVGLVGVRLSEIPKDRDVIFYCASGHRASLAYGNLRKRGYTRIWNAGAMGGIR